jgi:hypothetical protein
VLAASAAGLPRAQAAPLEAIVLPPGPLVADGERVHTLELYLVDGDALATRAPQVTAQHGAVLEQRAAPDGGVYLRYRPPKVAQPASDTLTIAARGHPLSVNVPLEPAGRLKLAISVSPDPLLLGRGATAEVRVHVRDAAGRPARAPLRLGASIGRVSPAVEVELGEYRATFTPPEDRFPQVAIVAALSVAGGEFAAVPCRLSARVTVPGEGEPGASMRIVVDGRTFGPQTVGPDGKFALGIVVPPGGRAVGVSTDRLGNRREREIDLSLPPFPRLLLAAVPPELPADGRARAEVVAFAVDARGAPERNKPPALSVDRGALSPPQARGDGSTSWTFIAPAGATGAAMLRAGSAQARIGLRPAPPYKLELSAGDALAAGSNAPASVEVRVRDAAGAPVPGARLTATLAGGRVTSIEERAPGRYTINVIAPRDPGRGSAALHVEVGGVEAGAPRRVTLHPARAPAGMLAAEAWTDDDLGLPVAGALVELHTPRGASRVESDRYGTARVELLRPPPTERRFRVTAELAGLPGLEAALDYLQVGGLLHTVASTAGTGLLETEESAPGATLDAEISLKPGAPIDLQLTVEPERAAPGRPRALRVRVRIADASGKPASSGLVYQASGGQLDLVRAPEGGAAELRFTPPPGAHAGERFLLSVTDPKTRVTAFTEVVLP